MAKHAMLSASGASRWLACTPSPVFEQQFPDQESDYADEGTLAHELANLMIQHLGYGTEIDRRVKELQENKWYCEEMMEYVTEYAQFVVDKVREIPGEVILILEQKLDLRKWIPHGFGTIDVGIIYDGCIETVDLKYGKGVPVDAYENKQQMVYGLGALDEFEMLFPIHKVKMTIYQPRINNISDYEISVKDLLFWANSVLKPTALIAYDGGGQFVAGDHCRFCRGRAVCKTRAAYNLQIATREFSDPQTITDQNVVKILQRAQEFKRWVTSIEEMALKEALKGKKWPGLKVVRGRSTRKITKPDELVQKLVDAGYKEEDLLIKKYPGITDLSKKISKLHFSEIVEEYLIKPPGAPALVSESDQRPELDAGTTAEDDFDDYELIDDSE